jgi:hypothetical protein
MWFGKEGGAAATLMSGRKLFHCHAVNFFTNILFEFIKQNAAEK